MKNLLLLCICLFVVVPNVMANFKVAIIFDNSGKNDKSFNQSAWEGALKAEKELGIMLKAVEPSGSHGVENSMRVFAAKEYNLIFGIGVFHLPAIKKMAIEYPNIKFAIVDGEVDLPNVSSIKFKEHEGSYLVGMIAAMRSRVVNGERAVGFIGGMDIPLIHKFQMGFAQGAKRIYPEIKLYTDYIGNTYTAWNDPVKARKIANAQIKKGASVIYAAAGKSGTGLFEAIKEINGEGPCHPKFKNRKRVDQCIYAIGVDSNQNYVVPGQVITSMLKRVGVSVFNTIKSAHNGTLKSGLHIFGLHNNGVGYAYDKYNKKLITPKMRKVVDKFKEKIIKGDIKVLTDLP